MELTVNRKLGTAGNYFPKMRDRPHDTYSLVLFLLFLTGFAGVLIFRIWQVKKVKSIPFSPQQSSFTLKPPSDALKGELVLAKGKVEKNQEKRMGLKRLALKKKFFSVVKPLRA